jgi:hypothetical protein
VFLDFPFLIALSVSCNFWLHFRFPLTFITSIKRLQMENIRTHRNVLLQEEHAWAHKTGLTSTFCIEVTAKPGKWSFMYICARNIKFNSVSTIVDQILELVCLLFIFKLQWQKVKRQNDKQRYTQHFTENLRLINTNPTEALR